MSYYTALQTAWNSSIQPPTGVTGTGLSSADTTNQKLAKVNAWTVTGSVPTSLFVTGPQILNCIAFSEFNALTATQQSNVIALCNSPGQLLGGSANVSLMVAGMIVSYFPSSGTTIANLTNLAKATTVSWAQTNGYPYNSSVTGNLNLGDTAAAGLT